MSLCFDSVGTSPLSDPLLFITTPPVPSSPFTPTCSERAATTLDLQWRCEYSEEYRLARGGGELEYELEIASEAIDVQGGKHGRTFALMYVGPESSYECTDLLPGVKYKFRVRARNQQGYSNYR